MNMRCLSLLAAFAVFAVSQADPPQYTVVFLKPAGTNYGWCFGIGHGQQVGFEGPDPDHQSPALWSGSAASYVNLLPAGYTDGGVEDTDGTHQFGYAYPGSGTYTFPAMWSGTAASYVNMAPPGSGGGWIIGCDSARQAGTNIVFGNVYHAAVWSGTPQSFVDIHPNGYNESEANDVQGDLVVGEALIYASGVFAFEWNLATNTTRNLNPNGILDSTINGTDGHQHVGWTNNYTNMYSPHAALWDVATGTYTDLNPAGSTNSVADDVNNGTQVGAARLGGGPGGAVLWKGTPESVFDLQQFLPPGTGGSEAYAIDEQGNIAGEAYILGIVQPVMWIPVQQTPPPYDFLGFYSPLNDPASPESVYQQGRAIPIKFQLKDNGLFVISAICSVSLEKWNGSAWVAVDTSIFSSPADDANNVRFDVDSDMYFYILNTKNLDAGRYRITVTVADTQQTHSDTFTLTNKPGKGK